MSKSIEYEKSYQKKVASPFDANGNAIPAAPTPTVITQSDKDLQGVTYTKKAGSIYSFRR